MIHCVQGDTGPAGCTLLFHLAPSYVTGDPVHNPMLSLGWVRDEGIHSEAPVSLLHGASYLSQIRSSRPYSFLPPKFLLLLLFSSTEDVTEFSQQHETLSGKRQVYFAQRGFAR